MWTAIRKNYRYKFFWFLAGLFWLAPAIAPASPQTAANRFGSPQLSASTKGLLRHAPQVAEEMISVKSDFRKKSAKITVTRLQLKIASKSYLGKLEVLQRMAAKKFKKLLQNPKPGTTKKRRSYACHADSLEAIEIVFGGITNLALDTILLEESDTPKILLTIKVYLHLLRTNRFLKFERLLC